VSNELKLSGGKVTVIYNIAWGLFTLFAAFSSIYIVENKAPEKIYE
jgi:hypothetical protein